MTPRPKVASLLLRIEKKETPKIIECAAFPTDSVVYSNAESGVEKAIVFQPKRPLVAGYWVCVRHLLREREREGDAKKDATKTLTYAEAKAAEILLDLHAREQHCRCLTQKG